VALPALHWNVTVEDVNVDPGGGLSITAGPVGGGADVAVGVGVAVGAADGTPVEVTVKDPALPTVKTVLLALVIWGAERSHLPEAVGPSSATSTTPKGKIRRSMEWYRVNARANQQR
jgi:hypothetical protein